MAVVTIKVGDVIGPDRLRRDAEAVAALGWFADVSVRLEVEPGGLRVVFLVVENPVVTEVLVEGNTVIATPEILRALNIPTGQVLHTRQTREGVRAVEQLYESRGYVLARVIDINLEPAGDGRLRVHIAEGRIEDIVFKGLTKTRPPVARRYVQMKRDDIFNVQQLNADLQRLFETGLFETVQARPLPGSTPDTVIIEIEVKEARTATIGVGVGYGSTEGIVGEISFEERNWRGQAQTLALRAERGFGGSTEGQEIKFSFTLAFRDPFLDDKRTSLNINLFQTSATTREVLGGTTTSRFTLDEVGSFIEVGRPLDPATVLSVRLRSELATITPLPLDPSTGTCPLDCPAPTFFEDGRTVSLTFTGMRDTRDSRIAPTKGNRQLLSLEFALPPLGSKFNFQKYYAEYVQYIPLGQAVIAARIAGGLGSGSIPGQELFVLGGPGSLRGFSSAEFRGTQVALANVEFRTPLGGIAELLKDFTGVLFVDVGQVWGPLPTNGFKTDYGVGVAFKSPLGVLRLDFAWSPEGSRTWLSLGHPF